MKCLNATACQECNTRYKLANGKCINVSSGFKPLHVARKKGTFKQLLSILFFSYSHRNCTRSDSCSVGDCYNSRGDSN